MVLPSCLLPGTLDNDAAQRNQNTEKALSRFGFGLHQVDMGRGKVPVAGATPLRAPYAAYCTFIAYAVLITALRPHYAVHRTDVA